MPSFWSAKTRYSSAGNDVEVRGANDCEETPRRLNRVIVVVQSPLRMCRGVMRTVPLAGDRLLICNLKGTPLDRPRIHCIQASLASASC